MSDASDPQENSLIGEGARSVTTVADEAARLAQALIDLKQCRGASLTVAHCPQPAREGLLAKELLKVARDRGFVTAHLSLRQHPLDAIEGLVSALLDVVVPPKDSRPTGGVLRLLELFFQKHGRRSLSHFDESCETEGATGDLTAICRAYLGAEGDALREVQAFSRWAEGAELKGNRAISGVRGSLDAHTGQRVFSELTRLVRALGYGGLFVVLSEADSIAQRTERQREKAYTLLREFVDNFDSGRGAVATRITITGGNEFFSGPRSLQSLAPLYARIALPSDAEPPPPHRTWTSLIRDPYEYVHRAPRPMKDGRGRSLRSLIRLSQGLPPVEAVVAMSVGHERVDKSIDKLFNHAEMSGSVFQVLSGEYGSGKTHILLHLAERALAQQHPVFWLNLERMNLDLGNPAKHLSRVLDQSVLPLRGRPSCAERLSTWTRSPRKLKELQSALEAISQSNGQEAKVAKKALLSFGEKKDSAALEEYLSARDLSKKAGGQGYRKDAYRRLLLWIELLKVMEGVDGPVVLVDEAENLYTTGVAEAARRSALRTLSFYCGGALPGACVILAMTPPALAQMRKESQALLKEAAELDSTLDLEDVQLFRHRLHKLKPDEVPALSSTLRKELAQKIREAHRQVRGPIEMENWDAVVRELVRSAETPRVLMRNLVDQLEAAWWSGA